MQVYVSEEHGYRDWIWDAPVETVEELIQWWKNHMTADFVDEFAFYDITTIEGEWHELEDNEAGGIDKTEDYEASAHIHTSETTKLHVGTESFSVS